MTLEKAILYVIEKEGIGIIGETRFVNYLNDLQAFDVPAVKRIVVTMVSGGYAEKLKHSLTTDHYQPDVNDAKSRLVNNEGFQPNIVEYVLNCLLFATKKTTLHPVMPSPSAAPITPKKTPVTLKPIKKSSVNSNKDWHYRLPTLDLLPDLRRIDPNDRNIQQSLRSAFSSKVFQETKGGIPLYLGEDDYDEAFVARLADLPHLLIAGSTGTGKSVLLHMIILSILYKLHPGLARLVLIDPQRVEFSQYAILENLFLAKSDNTTKAIISENEDVTATLVSLQKEIEDRYQLLSEAAVRNIVDYNDKWGREYRLDKLAQLKFQFLPRIVVMIDEFASYTHDIPNFNNFISNIASKGRAVGVHLILSTNAISARVLTPSLKSLFPAKIAFDVPQVQESVRILDVGGAEELNRKGSFLFKNGDVQVRLQSQFVRSSDINRICDYIAEQKDAYDIVDKSYLLGQTIVKHDDETLHEVKDRDPLFEEAVRFVVTSNTASTSSLQRRYEIGYNRASRLMDQMERAGIVGPAVGSKPRQVLVSPMDIDLLFDGGMPYIPKHIRTPLSSNQGEASKTVPQTSPPKKNKLSLYDKVQNIVLFIILIIIIIALFFAN